MNIAMQSKPSQQSKPGDEHCRQSKPSWSNPSAEIESDDREDPINSANRGEGEEAKSDGRRKTSSKHLNQTAKTQMSIKIPNGQQKPKRAAKSQTGNKNPNVAIET
jgi:hypothetical protein